MNNTIIDNFYNSTNGFMLIRMAVFRVKILTN